MKIFFYFFLIIPFSLLAQDSIPYFGIRNEVERNITFYRIYYLAGLDCCRSDVNNMISNYIPESGKNYDFRMHDLEKSEFSNRDIKLIEIDNNHYVIKKPSENIEVTFSDGQFIEDILSQKILIGYNTKTKVTIFIAGNVMKDCIASEFKLDIVDAQTFYPFLRYKLYNFDLEDIQLIKRKKKYLLFKASSKITGEIYIKLDVDSYDNLQVKSAENGWSPIGSYNWKK